MQTNTTRVVTTTYTVTDGDGTHVLNLPVATDKELLVVGYPAKGGCKDAPSTNEEGRKFAEFCYRNAHVQFMDAFRQRWNELSHRVSHM